MMMMMNELPTEPGYYLDPFDDILWLTQDGIWRYVEWAYGWEKISADDLKTWGPLRRLVPELPA